MGEGGARVAKRRGRVRVLNFPLGEHVCNRLDRALGVAEHLMVPEPDHPEAPGFEKPGAVRIDFFIMLPAIDLHDEHVTKAEEVGVEGADDRLTSELCLRQLFAETAL
jgi:hypothetical protein